MNSPSSLLPFILITEKLKLSNRATNVIGAERKENSAEHSWQVALLALVLSDFSNEKIDVLKVLKMLLIHDLPEAICGDTPIYSEDRADAAEREAEATKECFFNAPESLNQEFLSLWNEFNERKTAEAKFCACLDRLMPFVQNLHTAGGSWIEFNVNKKMVIEKSEHAKDGSEEIWKFLLELIDRGVENGFLRE